MNSLYVMWLVAVIFIIATLILLMAYNGAMNRIKLLESDLAKKEYLIENASRLSMLELCRVLMMNTVDPGHWSIFEDKDDQQQMYGLIAFKKCQNARVFHNTKINLEGVLDDNLKAN